MNLKKINKTIVIELKLHEIKEVILVDYTGEFEMVGAVSVGEHI